MATYDPKAELLKVSGYSTEPSSDAKAKLLKSVASIKTGVMVDPDQAARARMLSSKIDVPQNIIMDDVSAAESRAKMLDIQEAISKRPALSKWSEDQYNASISHDDIDSLSMLDDAISSLRSGASFTGQALASFIPRINEGFFGIAQAGTEIGALVLDPLVGNVLPQNPLAVASSFFSEQRRQSAEAAERWMPNTEGNLQAGIASGVQSLGQNLAMMPFALVNPAAGLALMTAPVFGQSFGEARDAGASLPTSINYAGVNTGAEYVFERMPLFKLVEDMNVGTSFLKTLGKQLALEITGEQLTTIVQDMNEWAVLNPDKPFSDYLAERPDAALQTLIATAVGAGGQVSLMKGAEAGVNAVSRRIEAAARAEAKAQYIESAGKALKASKTMGRDAESVEAFIEQAIADGKMDVYIDAATLNGNEFYQDIIAASPSVRDQVELAAATGEEVRISAVEYLTKIAPQEFAKTLTDDIRLDGEDFTRRQAREFMSKEAVSGELQNEMQSLIERADKDANTFLELNSLAQTIADNANFGDKITDEQKLESSKQIAANAITLSRRLGRPIEDVIAMLPGVRAESVIPGGNAMMQSDGITTIYHGTTPEAAEAIEAGGFDTSKSSDGTIWFTSNPEIGEVAATGKGAVVKRAFSESGLKLGGWEESYKYSVAELIAQGYDGLKLVDEGETTYQIFNPDKLEKVGDTGSTGSQLTGRTGVEFFQGADDYRGEHEAPTRGEGSASADNLAGVYPDDVYSNNQVRYYGTGDSRMDAKSFAVINRVKGKPKASVTIYRAVPYEKSNAEKLAAIESAKAAFLKRGIVPQGKSKDTYYDDLYDEAEAIKNSPEAVNPDYKINPGDWVTINKDYAVEHGESALNGNYKIISKSVKASDIFTDGNSIHEWGWDPAAKETTPFKPDDEPKDLIATHNLTAANLLHAEKMGGLPVPSLAVVKKNQPLSGFGEITLIAPSDLINPKTGAKVFGADIYSPRYPRVTYQISAKDQRKAETALTGAQLATDSRIEFSEVESEGPRYLERNRAMMFDFLQSKGITPKIVRREAKAMSEVFEPFANTSKTARELAEDHAFMDAVKERYIDIMTIVYANTEGDNEGKTDRQMAEEEWARMDDQDRRKKAYQYGMEVKDIIRRRQQEGQIEGYATERAMRDQIENDDLEAEFATHIEKFIESMNPEEKIFQGFTPSGNRKYIEHSLDNVIKILKKELRGGESFNYGLGSVRAKYTPEFKSIEAIRKEKGRLTDKDSFAKIKEEMNVEFEAIADKLAQHHTYSGSLMNAVADTLADAAKMGIPRALSYNGFEGVPDSTMEEMRTFLQQLKNMPTEYFEAKVLRAVELNEFGAAVVPDNVDQKVIDILRKRGITDIRTYKSGDEADRARAIAEEEKLLFQKRRGAFSPERNLIIMLKDADLSTFLHESGHFFLENHIAVARQIIGEASFFGWENLSAGEKQHLTDVGTLMKWYDIGGDIVEQIGTWDGMDFEEQRDYHERFAEGYERYLFEGNAPSIELVDVFKQFTVFLKRVYRNIKNMMDINKRAELLTDEVREVMDRMLATDEQIEIIKKARGMTAAFQTAEQGGMTIEEFKAYQDHGIDADDDAAIDLAARSLRDLKWARNAVNKRIKELQKEAKAARAQVTMEVRPLVMSQPVYQAWRFLTGKMTRDDKRAVKPVPLRKSVPGAVDAEIDSLFVAIAKLGGIDREMAEYEWGWDRKEKSPMPVFGAYVLRREGGKTIDQMAEALSEYGYLDVDEHGKWDLGEFENAFFAENRGDKVYSKDVDHEAVFGSDELQGAGVTNPNLNEGAGVKAGRLDRGTLEAMGLPAETIARLEELGMLDDIGIHPDIVAQISGYESGDQMIQEIIAAKPPKEAIAEIVDQRMLDEYADLATDEAMKDAADLAVHNEARGRFIATEANAIAKLAGKPKLLVAAAKELAGKMVGRMTVGELKSRSHALGLAEARSSKAKLAASKDGNWNEAATHARNQVINFQANKATKEAHESITKRVKAWSELSRKSDERIGKTYDIDILNAFRSIIGEYGIAEKRAKKAGEYLERFKTYDPEMYGVIKESVDAAQANAKPFNKMTVDEFRALEEEIDAILHLAKRVKQSEVDGNLLDIQDAENALINQMNRSGRSNVNYGQTSAITAGEERAMQFMAMRGFNRRIGFWVESMDLSDFGPFRQFIWQPIKDAAIRYRSDRAKYLRKYRELLKPIEKDFKPGLIYSHELGYTFGKDSSGSGIAEILHMIIHTGNDSNKRKLLLGRKKWAKNPVTGEIVETEKRWGEELEDGTVDDSFFQAFISRMVSEGKLRKEHYDFVQGVWDLLEETKPLAQKTHRDVFGKYFDEVSADGFTDPFGIPRRGGYAPAQVDTRIVKDKAIATQLEAENQSMSYSFATTQKGWAKQRTEYNRPLLLDLKSFPQHIDKVLKFSHMEGVGRDVQRLLNGDAGKRLTQIDPTAIDAMLIPWINRAVKQVVDVPSAGTYGWMNRFAVQRARAGINIMFGNVINALQQLSGFTTALTKFRDNPALLASAFAQYMRNPRQFAEAVASMSKYMDIRMQNEIESMNGEINDILMNPSIRESMEAWGKRHGYFLQSAMDNVMSPIIWMAAYNAADSKGIHDHEMKVKYADGVIEQTQGSTQPEDISRFESGGPVYRIFTQFYSYPNMIANLMGTEFAKVMHTMGLRKGAGQLVYIYLLAFSAPAIIGEAIRAILTGNDDDEDDDGSWIDDWIFQVGLMSQVKMATSMIPGGQVINAGLAMWNDKPYDDRLQMAPAVSMIEGSVMAPYSVYQAVVNDGSKQKAVRDLSTAMSVWMGIPAGAAARPAGYLAGVWGGEIDPTSGADFARGMLTGIASNESKQ